MRILIVGATGTLGSAVAKLLGAKHEIVAASRRSDPSVDIENSVSIDAMFRAVGPVDAVVCTAGSGIFAPLAQLTDADVSRTVASKLMGQVNVVRHGLTALRDGGSFTLTSGSSGGVAPPGFVAIGLANGGLEGFVRAAATELGRGRRINAVSPGWVAETLTAMGRDPAAGVPAAEVAKAYARSVESAETGAVFEVL